MSIDAASWNRLRQAFEECIELAPEVRGAELLRALADSPELQAEALAMLKAHESEALLEIEKHLLTGDEAPAGGLEGTSIGLYRIERLIGRGGMGEVYLAERQHPDFRQKVALKLLRSGVWDAEGMARFKLERQILARLNHPHIAPLLDGGVAPDGRPYLVLQYVEGAAITAYCESRGVSQAVRLELFRTVARAVEYAHRNLVVHRDLKPGNILVTEEGGVRLLDFGVAKLLDPSPGEAENAFTRVGQRPMTVEYAAPEQLEGKAITTATDVYALGIVLHELLAGVRPGQDPARRLHGDLATMAAKAMEAEPERRYASAGELARDIERYLAGEPVQARKPSFGYRLGKLVRRNPLASSLTVLSVVLLVMLAATATRQSRRIARERDTARREQQKAERVVAMMTDLFAVSDPTRVPGGSDLTVGEFLKRIQADELQNRGLDPEVQARLKQVLGEVYMARSQYPQARALLEEAFGLLRGVKGDNDPAAAGVFHDLARLAANTDPPEKAVALLRESLARQRRIFGDKDERVAAAMEDLAESLPATAERLDLLNVALAMRRGLDGRPSLTIASNLDSLGEYYFSKENFAQAEAYFSQALAMTQQLYPKGHPAVFTAMSNLAAVYGATGRIGEAAALNSRLVDLKTRLMGPDTVEVAIALGNLGVSQAQQGDLAASEESLARALKLYIQLLGHDHQQVANASRNLGCVKQYRGRYSEAVALLGDAVAIQRKLGGDEAVRLGIEGQLAVAMIRAGSGREGIEKLRGVVARYRVLKPSGYYMMATTEVALGFALLEAGIAAEAETMFREALAYRSRWLPAGHAQIAEAECGLGAALRAQGKPESMLAPALAVYGAYGLADPVEVARLRRRLAAGR